MADKEAESVPFIHIENSSFLKRTWRYDPEVGAYLAPLEHDSIEKMLMVWVRSKSISTEEQIIAVITSAMREYFFYGRQVFEEKQAMLKEMLAVLDIEDWICDSTFPTFTELKKEFWECSKRANCLPEGMEIQSQPQKFYIRKDATEQERFDLNLKIGRHLMEVDRKNKTIRARGLLINTLLTIFFPIILLLIAIYLPDRFGLGSRILITLFFAWPICLLFDQFYVDIEKRLISDRTCTIKFVEPTSRELQRDFPNTD
jgi:hypothetical protein